MKFKNSPYYNKKLLGQGLYEKIYNNDMVFTIQEFFNINDIQKEYLKEGQNVNGAYYNYKLMICEDYYELDCQAPNNYLSLIFDKPVYITGKCCRNIIASEIVIMSEENKKNFILCC